MIRLGVVAVGAFLLAGAPWPAGAQRPDSAAAPRTAADGGQFVTALAQRAVAELTTENVEQAERVRRFRALLTEAFDVPGIGRFVLGRYWRVATEQEREEYLRLFEEMIVQTYAKRFHDFRGAQLKVLGTRHVGEGEAVAALEAILPNRAPARLDARLRQHESSYKIFDIVVEGVSMATTQRDDFSAVIQKNGGKVEGLLASLRERTRQTR